MEEDNKDIVINNGETGDEKPAEKDGLNVVSRVGICYTLSNHTPGGVYGGIDTITEENR